MFVIENLAFKDKKENQPERPQNLFPLSKDIASPLKENMSVINEI